MKILCIDDDPVFLELFNSTIRKHGHPDDEVILAENGTKGLELIRQAAMDIVITDLVMPDISGLDILRAINRQNVFCEVIVVTAQASVDSAVEAMKLGARDYLTKPLNTGMLIEKLEKTRDFIASRKEAEDYRFAKETIENQAKLSVLDMETRIAELMSTLKQVRDTAHAEGDSSEKIDRIRKILAS